MPQGLRRVKTCELMRTQFYGNNSWRNKSEHERRKSDRRQLVLWHFWPPETQESLHFSTCCCSGIQVINAQRGSRDRRRTPKMHRGNSGRKLCGPALLARDHGTALVRLGVGDELLLAFSIKSTRPVSMY